MKKHGVLDSRIDHRLSGQVIDFDRKMLKRGTWDYLRENVDYPYYLLDQKPACPLGRFKTTGEVIAGLPNCRWRRCDEKE
jgi:hypothetical protein